MHARPGADATIPRMKDGHRYAAAALCIGCVALAAAVVPGAGAKEARAARSCRPAHTATIASDAQVRVYQTRDRYGDRVARGCLYRTGRTYELGGRVHDNLGSEDFVSPVLLSGPIVGWRDSTADRYGGEGYEIKVRDLASGRVLHDASKGGADPYAARRLVMDRVGSVAWISTFLGAPNSPAGTQLFKSDTSHGEQLIDSSAGCCRSLRLTGRTLSWLDGSQAHTADFVH